MDDCNKQFLHVLHFLFPSETSTFRVLYQNPNFGSFFIWINYHKFNLEYILPYLEVTCHSLHHCRTLEHDSRLYLHTTCQKLDIKKTWSTNSQNYYQRNHITLKYICTKHTCTQTHWFTDFSWPSKRKYKHKIHETFCVHNMERKLIWKTKQFLVFRRNILNECKQLWAE